MFTHLDVFGKIVRLKSESDEYQPIFPDWEPDFSSGPWQAVENFAIRFAGDVAQEEEGGGPPIHIFCVNSLDASMADRIFRVYLPFIRHQSDSKEKAKMLPYGKTLLDGKAFIYLRGMGCHKYLCTTNIPSLVDICLEVVALLPPARWEVLPESLKAEFT